MSKFKTLTLILLLMATFTSCYYGLDLTVFYLIMALILLLFRKHLILPIIFITAFTFYMRTSFLEEGILQILSEPLIWTTGILAFLVLITGEKAILFWENKRGKIAIITFFSYTLSVILGLFLPASHIIIVIMYSLLSLVMIFAIQAIITGIRTNDKEKILSILLVITIPLSIILAGYETVTFHILFG